MCFFSEHWLAEEEEILFKNLSSSHNFFFKASFSLQNKKKTNIHKNDNIEKRGRPFDGLCWAVRKNLSVEKFDFFDDDVGTIKLNVLKMELFFHGLWLPFDDR